MRGLDYFAYRNASNADNNSKLEAFSDMGDYISRRCINYNDMASTIGLPGLSVSASCAVKSMCICGSCKMRLPCTAGFTLGGGFTPLALFFHSAMGRVLSCIS